MRFLDVIETSKDRQDLILARMETGRRRMLHFGPASIDSLLDQFTTDVKKIQSRGGQVIFIRPPSNGVFRQFEHDNYPRTKYWDKLIEATGCHGVHFEDHSELEELVCVEESHLSKSDAVLFTQRVINILVNNGIIEHKWHLGWATRFNVCWSCNDCWCEEKGSCKHCGGVCSTRIVFSFARRT